MPYSKCLQESSVPVTDLVEVEESAVGAVEVGDRLAFLSNRPFEEICGSLSEGIYLFFTLPKRISARSSFFLSWKTIDSVASERRLPMNTPE